MVPVPLTPLQPPYPYWYKSNLTREYHAGIAGHDIESCNAFKNKLLQLIKAGWITFDDAPNVNSNPFPKHVSSSEGVNVVEIGGKKERVLKVSMERLYGMLVQSGYLYEFELVMNGNNYCKFHGKVGHHIDDCEEFHQEVKRMLAFGMIRIGNEEESSEVGMTSC